LIKKVTKKSSLHENLPKIFSPHSLQTNSPSALALISVMPLAQTAFAMLALLQENLSTYVFYISVLMHQFDTCFFKRIKQMLNGIFMMAD
jgi:hypothetical protein